MRRISARYLQPGMILGRPVYSSNGYLLLELGSELTKSALLTLAKHRVNEIFVRDSRTADLMVHPMIAPEVEALAAQALWRLDAESLAKGDLSDAPLNHMERSVNAMARELFPHALGEACVTGCLSFEDYRFLQPAKVAGLSLCIGKSVGYDIFELSSLGMAALTMNVGYSLAQPWMIDQTGASPEKIDQEASRHPERGAEILGQYGQFNAAILEAVLQHHERWDGSGYPARLQGEDISPFARIIAVADTYYEMVSRMPNREPYMPHEAVEFILAYTGVLFDPELVNIVTRLVPLYPTGTTVRINTGELGIISEANLGHIGRPVVRVCFDSESGILAKPYDMNLADPKNQHKLVEMVDAHLPLLEE